MLILFSFKINITSKHFFYIDTLNNYQVWRGDVQDMGKLRTHKLFKENLIYESYPNEINICLYRTFMTKLRGVLLELRAYTGRLCRDQTCFSVH